MKLVGHKKQLRLLESALNREHLPNTLLFSGPQGVGKRIAALTLAEKILEADKSSKTSQSFWRGEHPDLHLIGLEEEKKDMERNVLDYEPHLALFVPDEDPLLFYRAIARFGIKKLNAGGHLYFEINARCGAETAGMLCDEGYKEITLIKDLSGKDRILKAQL